ncbi:hypothetical protein B0H34DRAFT_39411 [Crassisporium funariophilum]|nr:hypothetical protein B0H34DRAFT_39411 [Crassisporium funariophilum]
MMDSDTESQSDSECSSIANYGDNIPWLPRPAIASSTRSFKSFSSSAPEPPIDLNTVTQTVQNILCHPLTSFPCDVSLHDEIQAWSDIILSFVDDIQRRLNHPSVIMEVLDIFSSIVNPAFCDKLFEYRKFYRGIACRTEPLPLGATTVTWVDVLLAKLSLAIRDIAKGAAVSQLPGVDPTVPEIIELQQYHDTIRAATQLPDNWHGVFQIVSSSCYSSAAKRLALWLSFGAYVMGPQLKRTQLDPWSQDSPSPTDVLSNLNQAAGQISARSTPSREHTLHDRISAAMVLSLFSCADREVKHHNNRSPVSSSLRPKGFGCLLDLIRIVLNQDLQSYAPLETLDVAQMILLRWGAVTPWSWSTWGDHRVGNSECLLSLTSTWLYHLDSPFLPGFDLDSKSEFFGMDLHFALIEDIGASSKMVSYLLQHLVQGICLSKPAKTISSGVRRVIGKLCWAVVQLLQANIVHDEHLIESSVCCQSILLVFCCLGISEDDLFIKHLILEALALTHSSLLAISLRHLLQVKPSSLLPHLDQATRQSLVVVDSGDNTRVHDHELHSTRLLIEFLAILMQSDAEITMLQEIISSYLHAIVEIMNKRGSESLQARILRDPFLITFSIYRKRSTMKAFSKDDDQTIWNLMSLSKKPDIRSASAFAHYLLASNQLHDALSCHEAWDRLRDVMITIVRHQVREEEEPLALLCSTTICCGLTHLIRSSKPLTRQRLLSSPWTTSMCLALEKLIAGDTLPVLLYFRALQGKLEKVGRVLLDEIVGGLKEPPKETSSTVSLSSAKLIYYRDDWCSGILLVCDIEV